ncbi:MAG TPA: tetratricopeptide repeat protein, partial [Thermoplasmata archaeon]|nr:tetratricopeptide repeat protein [Thermoplasmata archaeon]
MLPSRCVRCGAASRDFLCGPCLDYLVTYRPLWLNPALLPGPSLVDLVAPRDVALVSADLSKVEWHARPPESSAADAVQLVRMLSIDGGVNPVLSEGDAAILHEFLQETRRSTPTDATERHALAAICRYLSSRDWMPSHLGSEYALRANVLEPPAALTETVGTADIAVSEEEAEAVAALEAFDSSPESHTNEETPDLEPPATDAQEGLPASEPFPPEPVPQPEPPLPIPEPYPPPQPEPEPEPEPDSEELGIDEAERLRLEAERRALETHRTDVEAWVRSRTDELKAKEDALVGREEELFNKERAIEEEARATRGRRVAIAKEEARRDVVRFLASIPGMSDAQADSIANAFPDMSTLTSADAKAITQCKGVTETLARAIRLELVPGEVDDEQRITRLREEAQSFLEEGEYAAALDCCSRLLRERPQDTSLWFDRAELLVLLDRREEALACYAKIIDLDPGNWRAWFENANLLFGMGRLPDAVEALREALRIDSTKARDIILKAEQLRRDGHPNEAVILFQAVLDLVPTETRAVLGLGDSLLDLGDMDAAESLFARALGTNSENPPILFRRGELLERKGRWGAAIQYYNRAIALRWNFVDPWLAKGRILLEHDRAKEALECFDKVLSFEPDRVEGLASKARAHAILGDRDAAENALERASAIAPDDPATRAARDALGAPTSSEPEAAPR